MCDSLQASIIDANTCLIQRVIKYIASHVMYTPMNMDKKTGTIKKRIYNDF